MALQIGDMRYQITVLKKSVLRDAYGAESIAYNNYMLLKASVQYQGGVKEINLNEIFTSNKVIFCTYYRDVQSDMLILFKGKKYRITSIKEVGFRTSLEISTELIND